MSWDPTKLRWACTSRLPRRYMLGVVVPTAPEGEGMVMRAPVASVTHAEDRTAPSPPEGLTDIETAALSAVRSGMDWYWEAEAADGRIFSGPAVTLREGMRRAEHVVMAPHLGPRFRLVGLYGGGRR